jgi:hypothetical protein
LRGLAFRKVSMQSPFVSAASILVATSLTLIPPAQADQQQVLSCIKQYTSLGVSPDAALAKCQQESLSGCIKKLLQKKFIANSIKFVPTEDQNAKENEKGFLIDLGNTESRWLEGKQWKAKGCSAYSQGPYKRQSDNHSTFWTSGYLQNKERSYEWFRQGWCPMSSLELDQPYSLEEANLHCQLGIIDAPSTAPSKNEK